MKAAYHLALGLNKPAQGESSWAWVDCPAWKKLWKPQIPSKVKHRIWRACTNSLPTQKSPQSWHIEVDLICNICNQETETVVHAMWLCPTDRNVWAMVGGKFKSGQQIWVMISSTYFRGHHGMLGRGGGNMGNAGMGCVECKEQCFILRTSSYILHNSGYGPDIAT